MEEDKILLTPKQAKDILALSNDGMIHTFRNAPFGLFGADATIESIHNMVKLKKLEKQLMRAVK